MNKFNTALINGCNYLVANRDKIAKFMSVFTFAILMACSLCPTLVMAAGDGTDIVRRVIVDNLSPWLKAIGACVALIGFIQFALAFQRQDSEGKSNALLVVCAGCMVVGVGMGAGSLYDTFLGV